MTRTEMKWTLMGAAAMLASMIVPGCAALNAAPNAQQIAIKQNLCATVAAVRPIVIALAITPDDQAALSAFHTVIDGICAKPDESITDADTLALQQAAGQIAAFIAQKKAAK